MVTYFYVFEWKRVIYVFLNFFASGAFQRSVLLVSDRSGQSDDPSTMGRSNQSDDPSLQMNRLETLAI